MNSRTRTWVGHRTLYFWPPAIFLDMAFCWFVIPRFDAETHAKLLTALGIVFALAQYLAGLVLSKVEDLKNRTEGLSANELEEFLGRIRYHKKRIFWTCLMAYVGAATAAVCGVLVQNAKTLAASDDLLILGYSGLCLSVPSMMFSIYLYTVADKYADQSAVHARREQERQNALQKLSTEAPHDFDNDPHYKERGKIIPMRRKKS